MIARASLSLSPACAAGIFLFLVNLVALTASAQNTVQWTTNYYTVTGSNLREVHHSLRQERPWRDRLKVDGLTEWRVEWRFNVTASENGCRLTGFGTKTIILTTLPRWNPPSNAAPQASLTWSNYIRALTLHEAGHAAIAFAAAADMQKQAKTNSTGADCATLQQNINALGYRILEEHRQRDKQYDERTDHGATQGATLESGRRRQDAAPD